MKRKFSFEEGFVTFAIALLLVLCVYELCFAKTLVKYYKTTGDIIQTNTVDEMPSPEILAERFKSDTTDVLLYDGEVNIAKQRVDLNKKGIIDIPKKELDDAQKVIDNKNAEKKALKEKLKGIALEKTVGTDGVTEIGSKLDKVIDAVNDLLKAQE